MRSPIAKLCLALALSVFGPPVIPAAADTATKATFTQEELMAVFLYRLGSYIEWPESRLARDDPSIRLCVVGRDPFGSALAYHEGAPLKGRTFRVRRIGTVDPLDDCQILFLSETETKGSRVLSRFESLRGVLTTSDRPDFTCRGGILRFFVANESLKLEINPEAAEQAGLQISSKVLSLAQIVDPGSCGRWVE